MSELRKLCESKGLTASAKYGAAKSKGWKGNVHNWRVTLRYQGRQLTTDFFGGSAVMEADTASVLNSLLLDASYGEESYEDFLSELGYEDSREHRGAWEACVKMAPKVRRLLGDDFDAFRKAEH